MTTPSDTGILIDIDSYNTTAILALCYTRERDDVEVEWSMKGQ